MNDNWILNLLQVSENKPELLLVISFLLFLLVFENVGFGVDAGDVFASVFTVAC